MFEEAPPQLQPEQKSQAEKHLLDLNLEADKVKTEILKLENAKTKSSTALKQKTDLESRLDTINKKIAPLKTSLRKSSKR